MWMCANVRWSNDRVVVSVKRGGPEGPLQERLQEAVAKYAELGALRDSLLEAQQEAIGLREESQAQTQAIVHSINGYFRRSGGV